MNDQSKGYLMVLAAGSLWGTIGLFATLLSNMGMSAGPVAFFRVLSASIMLALILLVKGRGVSLFRVSRRGLISCMLVGFISQALYNVCYMNTIEQGGMATASVFLYTSPVYVALISRVFFHEPLTRNKIIAIIINIAGCILTVTGGDFSDMKISGFGIIMGIMAGFTYALLPILSRTGADDEDPFSAAFYGQAFGALLLFFLIRPYNGIGTAFTLPMLLVFIGFGIVPSAMGYIVYYAGLSRITETSIVPVLASVETVVAALIGLIVFGQALSITKIVGIALVLISIAIMNRKKN
ncbi:MAG: EamA family transporter [Mogibacterium sp.]|nr:EamA family transporter [Mogibacterium sp.]